MNVHFETTDGKGRATLSGSLNAATVDSFRDRFDRWLTENDAVRRLVIDLEALEFIDSAGLGVLIALLKRMNERGGDVRLARMQKRVRVVFEITRAYKLFEIFDAVEEALAAGA